MSRTFEKTSLPDDRLATWLCSGDEGAYEWLYDQYSSLLFGTLVRVVRVQAIAENLMQDCFVKVWKNAASFDHEKGKFTTWLINIARNTAIDYTRSKHFSQGQKNRSFEDLVHTEVTHGSSTILTDAIGLGNQLERLPEPMRQMIDLQYFQGFTQQEIADEFGIPLGTVKTRTRIALRELRKAFGEA